MKCGFSIKNTCGEKVFATCTYFEGVLPAFSTLIEADCYTLEEIVADIYIQLTDIFEAIEVTGVLSDSCLAYVSVEGKITTAEAIRTLDVEVCSLKEKMDNIAKYQLCDLPIKGCNLDLGTLQTECENEITTYGELIQALISGGVGSGGAANLQDFDVTNSNTPGVTVSFHQPGRSLVSGTYAGNSTTVITLDINKPVTVVVSNSMSASVGIYSTGPEFALSLEGSTFQFTETLTSQMAVGSNSNPIIDLYEAS